MEADENRKSGFWGSLPALLSGIAAVIAAVSGAVVASRPASPQRPEPPNWKYHRPLDPGVKSGDPIYRGGSRPGTKTPSPPR